MNKRSYIILAALLFTVITGTVLVIKQKDRAIQNGGIRIGAILPLTGSSASAAEYAKQGIQVAIEDLNRTAPPGAPRISVDYADSKNSAKDGLAAFNQLNSAKGIQYFIATNSGVVVPLTQSIGKRDDVLLMTTFSSAPGIPEAGPNIFRLFVTAENEATTMATFLSKKGIKSCAVFYINDDFGLGGLNVFRKEFATSGGTLAWTESWEKGGADFRSSLQKIPRDVSALYVIGYEAGLGLSVKQAREIGYSGLICTTVGMSVPPWRAAAAEAAEGVYFTNTDFSANSERAETKAFVDAFQKMHGSKPNPFSAFAYELTLSLGRALHDASSTNGAPTPKVVSSSLQSSPSRATSLGPIQFGTKRDANPVLSVWTIRNGEEQPVEKTNP
jgi:branched-chain amino acid transport system substrate-binding protein